MEEVVYDGVVDNYSRWKFFSKHYLGMPGARLMNLTEVDGLEEAAIELPSGVTINYRCENGTFVRISLEGGAAQRALVKEEFLRDQMVSDIALEHRLKNRPEVVDRLHKFLSREERRLRRRMKG